jgi:predicted nucleic acid-binding protein
VRDKNHCAAESRLKRKTLLKLQRLVPRPSIRISTIYLAAPGSDRLRRVTQKA